METTDLYIDIKENQWPIIYRPEYNVHFIFGLERIHPSDGRKWCNVFEYLKKYGVVNDLTVVSPNIAKVKDLSIIHSSNYLRKLKCSLYVAQILEVPILMFVPNCIIQRGYLKPMRYQTGGSILAGKLALERGWAINLGGGFHHCSKNKGAGFCAYADIQLLISFLFKHFEQKVKKVMIIDLDAHQGNGYERDLKEDNRIFILDIYHGNIYPRDKKAKEAINIDVPVDSKITDEEYLNILDTALANSFKECKPDLIVYNAGVDILKHDPLGFMQISAETIQRRDEKVFQAALSRHIPIVMLLSGGYLKQAASAIGHSICNLMEKGLISGLPPKY